MRLDTAFVSTIFLGTLIALLSAGCAQHGVVVPLRKSKLNMVPKEHTGWVNTARFVIDEDGGLLVETDAEIKAFVDTGYEDVLVKKHDGQIIVYVPNDYHPDWKIENRKYQHGYQGVSGYHEIDMSREAMHRAINEGLEDDLVEFQTVSFTKE